jgi:hypothetical protein
VVRGGQLRLWWPNGYGDGLPNGERFLYELSTELHQQGNVHSCDVVDHIGIGRSSSSTSTVLPRTTTGTSTS